jgi:divalent metal cation (Fe/Co/Zn/Cd) transporter
VDRNTLLWTLVVFFGASIVFRAIRDATKDEPLAVSLLAAAAALGVMVAAITVFVRRRGGR